jgi:hypothetical protein
MSHDPAFGPKTLAHEFCAAADKNVFVIDARFVTDSSNGTRSARGFARSHSEADGSFRRRPSS